MDFPIHTVHWSPQRARRRGSRCCWRSKPGTRAMRRRSGAKEGSPRSWWQWNRSHQRWRSEDFGMDFLRFLEDVNGICMESSETFREKLDRNLEKFTEISWISEIVWLKCPKNILWTFFFNISETNHPKLVVSGIPYTFLALGSARFSGPHEGKPKVVRCSWRRNQPPAQSKRWPFWCSPFEKLGLSNWLRVWKRTQWSPQISSYFSFAVVSLCFCFVVEYQMARNDRRDLWRDDHVVSHRGNDVGHRHYFKRIWGWILILSDLWNTIWNRHTSYHIYPYYGSGMIRWSMKSYIWGMDIHESQLWIGVTTFDRPYPS